MTPADYWNENHSARARRVAQQEAERRTCRNDHMALVYDVDIDEMVAELLRLHGIVGDARTTELLQRILPERKSLIDEYGG